MQNIYINANYENLILEELMITPNLVIIELESAFLSMEDFSSPLLSQPNIFEPQLSSELGIISLAFITLNLKFDMI